MKGSFVVLAVMLSIAACGDKRAGQSGLASLASGSTASVPYAPTPDPDPFYAQPVLFPDAAPGTILNSRKVRFVPGAGISLPNDAWQIQYVSRGVNGDPQAVVAAVVKSLIPSTRSPAPLVSYQFAYDSLGTKCVPSRTVTGDMSNDNSQAEALIYLSGLMTQGWTMVFPDYEGPYGEYGAGAQAGHATLDGIRAALSFAPLGRPFDQS